MNAHDYALVLSGANIFGSAAIAWLFLRFWRLTRERLFAWFAASFVLLAVERVLAVTEPFAWVHQPQFYCTRLVAYLMIVCAILDKNRQAR